MPEVNPACHAADASREAELTYRAIRAMAVGASPLVERLNRAWNEALSILVLSGVPWPDLAEKFRDIGDFFDADPRTGRRGIECVDDHHQYTIACEIFDLCVEVSRRDFALGN